MSENIWMPAGICEGPYIVSSPGRRQKREWVGGERGRESGLASSSPSVLALSLL